MKDLKNIKKVSGKTLVSALFISFLLTGCCDIPLVPFVKNDIEKSASQKHKNQV